MKYHTKNGMQISSMTLGTVQLGLDYSINQSRPDYDQSLEILKQSVASGITVLDTAREYGNSEEMIGAFLTDYPDVQVVTKFKIPPEKLCDPELAYKEACDSVVNSCQALGLEKIPILLFHKGPEHGMPETCRVIPQILEKLKKKGMIGMGGISVFDVSEIPYFLNEEVIEALQIPLNVMDHRLFKSNIYEALLSKEKVVFARSIFLKGLFFKPPMEMRGKLDEALPYLTALHELAERYGMDIGQIAVSFVRDLGGITSLVIGADNPEQVRLNVELMEGSNLDKELKENIYRIFRDVPEQVITPYQWKF